LTQDPEDPTMTFGPKLVKFPASRLVQNIIHEPAAPRSISRQSNHFFRLAERIGADIDEPLRVLAPAEPESGSTNSSA